MIGENPCVSPGRKEDTVANEFEIDLLRVCKALWKKAWAIVLCAVVFGGCMLGYGMYTYIPMYSAKSTMRIGSSFEKQYIFEDNTGRVTTSSLSEARSLVDTCGAMLKTRTVLEKVVDAAGINITPEKLAEMIASEAKDKIELFRITVEAIDKTELFRITVTGSNPEEAAQIANAITQVLPEEMATVNSIYTLHTVDSAITPSVPEPNSIMKNTVLAAALGSFLACTMIAAPDILQQYREWKPSPAPCQVAGSKSKDTLQ